MGICLLGMSKAHVTIYLFLFFYGSFYFSQAYNVVYIFISAVQFLSFVKGLVEWAVSSI